MKGANKMNSEFKEPAKVLVIGGGVESANISRAIEKIEDAEIEIFRSNGNLESIVEMSQNPQFTPDIVVSVSFDDGMAVSMAREMVHIFPEVELVVVSKGSDAILSEAIGMIPDEKREFGQAVRENHVSMQKHASGEFGIDYQARLAGNGYSEESARNVSYIAKLLKEGRREKKDFRHMRKDYNSNYDFKGSHLRDMAQPTVDKRGGVHPFDPKNLRPLNKRPPVNKKKIDPGKN